MTAPILIWGKEGHTPPMAKRFGFVLGGLGFVLLYAMAEWAYPGGAAPSPGALKVAAVAFLMAAFWVTEALPIPATSLLPLVLFPVMGIAPVKTVAPAYSDKFILLLMGGFFVALGLERWNLHKRLALRTITAVGTQPSRLVLGFMLAGAGLSMWISNTATTLMMLPIALAVLQRVEERTTKEAARPLGIALLLGIAYACNIGGVGTPIGTPPNLIFMSQYAVSFPAGTPISFLDWMLMTLPVVVFMVGAIWWVLVRGVNRVDDALDIGDRDAVQRDYNALGDLSVPERRVLMIFISTALLWVFRKPIALGGMQIGGWAGWLGLEGLVDDSTVAIAAALVMFALPAGDGSGERLLNWATAVKIPWGLLLLFGGGLALAAGFKETGLSEWVGQRLGGLAGLPTWLMVGVVALCVKFLTEVTSNTATTTILMPVLGSVCTARGISPMHLMLPAAISASCAFMLPVATAPNAIVFGTGRVRMTDMVRLGVVINLIGVVITTLVLSLW